MRLNKHINGALLAMASMSAMMIGSGTASAALTSNFSGAATSATNAKTLVVAAETIAVIKQNQATGSTTAVAANNGILITAGVNYPVGSTITIQVNGATFNGAPNLLTANTTVVNGLALATAANLPVTGTLVGTNQVQFKVVTTITPANTITFNVNDLQTTNLTATAGSVTYTITVNNPPAGGGAAIDGSPYTTGAAFNVTTGVTGSAVANVNTIADVAQLAAGTPFVFNAAAPLANANGNVGSNVTFTNVTTAQPVTAAGFVVKLAGSFAGIAGVNTTGTAMTASSPAGVATAGATANTMTINALKTQATAIFAGGIPAGVAVTFNPQLVFDGVTQQAPRGFVASGDLIAVGTFSAKANIVPATIKIATITNNGMVVTTDLMGTASANIVVLRDRSGILPVAGGRIIMTGATYPNLLAGATAGTTFGPITLATRLASGGQVVLTPASIAADANVVAAGGIPAGAAARYVFTVETSSGSASEKKQVAGVGLATQTNLGGTLF